MLQWKFQWKGLCTKHHRLLASPCKWVLIFPQPSLRGCRDKEHEYRNRDSPIWFLPNWVQVKRPTFHQDSGLLQVPVFLRQAPAIEKSGTFPYTSSKCLKLSRLFCQNPAIRASREHDTGWRCRQGHYHIEAKGVFLISKRDIGPTSQDAGED